MNIAHPYSLMIAGLLMSGTAQGQTPAPGADEQVTQLDAIQVSAATGSRIARAGYEAPTPVTILETDALFLKTPGNIADALNTLPTLQGSISPMSFESSQANGVRGNYLNLRGLGVERTLIMHDGRRVAPSGNNGSTDINLIPQMLLRQVDVVTGGASAAYGSDAVSGVVNFITDTEFTGLKTLSQIGMAGQGDNTSWRVGIAGGVERMDGRLNLIASVEHADSAGIKRRSDRNQGGDVWVRGGRGTSALPYQLYDHAAYNYLSLGGVIANGPLAGWQFIAGGDTVAFNPGSAIPGVTTVAQNGEGAGHSPDCCTMLPDIESDQFFTRASLQISSNLSAFAQVAISRTISRESGILFQRHLNQMTIHRDNPFLSDVTRAALGDTATFGVARSFDEWGPNPSIMKSRGLNAAMGLEGVFGNDWRWELSYVRGDTRFTSRSHSQVNRRFYAALDAVRNAGGQIVCNITLIHPGLLDDCVPLNTFGPGAASLDARDWIMQDSVWSTRNRMDYLALDLAGDVLELPAGPLSLAGGVEYRQLSMRQTSNSDPVQRPTDYTGLRFAPAGLSRFYQPNVGEISGEYQVREAYVEINAPLLADHALVKLLELNGAYRLTDYSTSGSVGTWKAGFGYQSNVGIRLRGTLSRDIRAPSLTELFSGQNQRAIRIDDPLTGLANPVPVWTGGNLELVPEEGTTRTFGISFEPSRVPGWVISLDWYTIKVEGAIAAPYTGPQTIDLCHQSGGTSPLCNQIERPLGSATNPDPANFPIRILLTSQNVSAQEISGFDLETRWRRSFAPGVLNIRLLATRLEKFRQQRAAGQDFQDFAGTVDDFTIPLPKWRGLLDIGFDTGTWRINLQQRMIGALDRSHTAIWTDNQLAHVFYTDLGMSYMMGRSLRSMEWFLTINNLFDREGPLHMTSSTPGTRVPTVRSLYDLNGRYFTIGLKMQF